MNFFLVLAFSYPDRSDKVLCGVDSSDNDDDVDDDDEDDRDGDDESGHLKLEVYPRFRMMLNSKSLYHISTCKYLKVSLLNTRNT